MLISLLAGIAAALCYGVATVVQAIAVREAARNQGRNRARHPDGGPDGVDPGLLIRMLLQWRFTASIAVDLLGFGAQLVALHRLPLFTVQAMVAAELAVIAVLASVLMNTSMRGREWLAVAGVIAGIAMLGLSAGAEGAAAAGMRFKLALLIAIGVLAAIGFAVGRLRGQARTVALGAVAGLGYGVVGVAARVLTSFAPLSLVKDPAAYAIAAAAVVGFMFYTSALDGGDVTVTTAAIILTETLPPAVIGVLFLGDTTRPGVAPAAAAAVGFILAVSCALLLARFGEPDRGEPDHDKDHDKDHGEDHGEDHGQDRDDQLPGARELT